MRRIKGAIGAFALLGCLAGCGGGASSAGPAPVSSGYKTPLPYPAETPSLDGAPQVDEAWRDWLVANHHSLTSLDIHQADDSDLAFLQDAIGGRRIVLLGESSHRVDEFDQAKGRVIRYLHERMGFDVLVFESNIYSCFRAGEQLQTLAPDDAMHASIYGVWDCAATSDLFAYLQQTQATAEPMVLAGMDIQESRNDSAAGDSPGQLHDLIAPLDPAYADAVSALEQRLIEHYYTPGWIVGQAPDLEAAYRALSDWLDAHMDALVAANTQRPLWPRIARQLAWSRAQYMLSVQDGASTAQSLEDRDRGMAANLEALLALYPGKKIIVWAHNGHIQKAGSVVRAGYGDPWLDTGELLRSAHGSDMYAIGLYMIRGTTQENDGTPVQVRTPLRGSLEATLYTARRRQGFVDVLGAPVEPGTAWLDQSVPTLFWGTTPERMVLREQYDGILWVDTVHPPVYQ